MIVFQCECKYISFLFITTNYTCKIIKTPPMSDVLSVQMTYRVRLAFVYSIVIEVQSRKSLIDNAFSKNEEDCREAVLFEV